MTARSLAPFGTSIFSEMTRLAIEHDAINLSQGFPDFEGPAEIVERAAQELRAGENQYARSLGHPLLVRTIADNIRDDYDISLDPMTQVCVTSGATEALAASLLGLLDPGDAVVLFEPFYDSYLACARLAGAEVRTLPLRHPDFALDEEALDGALAGAKLLLLNTPHNPSGKVFPRAELEAIARLCRQHGTLVLTDEVYEHLAFAGHSHVPIATLPGMFDSTLTVSSIAKTYSFTGWKIGWVTGPARLVAAAQAAHQFLTFTVNTPIQRAMAWGMREFRGEYFARIRRDFESRHRLLVGVLSEAGFEPSPAQGGYFVLAKFGGHSGDTGAAFARELNAKKRVTALPVDSFYLGDKSEGHGLLRFAFCKSEATIRAAGERLR